MGIKQLYNDNLRKLPNEYGDVSVMRYKIPTDFAQILTLLTLYKLTIKSTTSMTCNKQVIVLMGK